MKNLLYVSAILAILLSGCTDSVTDLGPVIIPDEQVDEGDNISRSRAINFVNQIAGGLLQSESTTRAENTNRQIKSVEPVTDGNDTLMWVINYDADKGYVVMSAKKNCFPILSFNDTGYFDPTNETNEIWLKDKSTNQYGRQ